jgi:hypothetical protein
VREVFPDLDGQSFFELLDSVYKSTTPHIGRRMPISFQSGDKPARTAFLDFVYQPIMDDIGNVSGIFVQGTDVTDLHEAEFALRDKDLQLTLALDAATDGVGRAERGVQQTADYLARRDIPKSIEALNAHPGFGFEHTPLRTTGEIPRPRATILPGQVDHVLIPQSTMASNWMPIRGEFWTPIDTLTPKRSRYQKEASALASGMSRHGTCKHRPR